MHIEFVNTAEGEFPEAYLVAGDQRIQLPDVISISREMEQVESENIPGSFYQVHSVKRPAMMTIKCMDGFSLTIPIRRTGTSWITYNSVPEREIPSNVVVK